MLGTLLELHSEITELVLFEPRSAPLAQERLADDEKSKDIIEAGLAIRRDLGLPFWDAALLSCFGSGLIAFPVLEKALFHNSPPQRRLCVSRSDWSAHHLARVVQEVGAGRMLVVSSRVRLSDGNDCHIPMLDFHCPVSEANQEIAAQVAHLLNPSGGTY